MLLPLYKHLDYNILAIDERTIVKAPLKEDLPTILYLVYGIRERRQSNERFLFQRAE